MVLGKLPELGRPTSLNNSMAMAYFACSWCLVIFTLVYLVSLLSPSLGGDPI